MAATVIITLDRSEEVLKSIKQAAGMQVLVGIPEGSTRRDTDVDNALIAYVQEFGSPARNIPPRPFLVPSLQEKRAIFVNMLKQAVTFQTDGRSDLANNILESMGLKAVAIVKNYLTNSGNFTPLAEATLQRRRNRRTEPNNRDSPLRDTLQLFNAIAYVVIKK